MKLRNEKGHLKNENVNYCATVVEVKALFPLEGLDNLVGASFFGFTALVPKTTKVGDVGVVFTAETQLSHEFCHHNNLYRHSQFNEDPQEKGYIGDNRRVKALKLRGNISSALFLSLDCLAYLEAELSLGDAFTHVGDQEVCRKYVVKVPQRSGRQQGPARQKKEYFKRVFPEHFDTAQYQRNHHLIPDDARVVVTQKLHGTSARYAYQCIDRELSWWEKLLKALGVRVEQKEWAHLVGTRRTVRNSDTPGYYDDDVWTKHSQEVFDVLPKGWIIYGEIVGYAGESPIQKNYGYRHSPGESSFYVYRIATVNEEGRTADLGWEAVKQFCLENGLKHVPEMYSFVNKGELHMLVNGEIPHWEFPKTFEDTYLQCLPLDDASPCDEGFCVRREGVTPHVLKYKFEEFYEHETKMLDQGAEDMEAAEA